MGVKGYAIHLSFSPGNGVLMRDNTPKSTRTQGGDPIADYIRADTRLPAYLPYPRFLLKMEISQTAKLLYSLLLDRSTLSQKNKWLDDEGRIYIIYPIAEIAEILDKGSTTIKGALNELDTAGLLERERGGFSAPNRLYVKVPPVPQVQFSDQLMAGSPPLIEPENRPTDGQKTDLMMVGKPSPNQTTINNLTESQTKGVSGGPSAPYGRYGNIFLSQTEYDELQAEYPDRLERFIEEMSRYLAASFEGRNEYISRLCRYPLLILDDFGMERGTEYGLEQVFNVIDSRYRSGKPLIVTTNLTLDDLRNPEDTAHSRIYDRLLSMCVPVRFTGDNFRQEAAQRKMESMKKLITD